MFDTASIANRLALIFFAITLGAMAIVYVGVVPRLESSLIGERATLLEADGVRVGAQVNAGISRGEPVTAIDRQVKDAADRANARVTLIGAPATPGGTPFVKSDSNRRAEIGDLRFPAALAAIASGRPETATENSAGGRVVQTAVPLYSTNAETGRRVLSNVLVLSSPLNDVEENVSLVRNRILLATVIALIAALLGGYLVARAFGRRVGRLEQTARRVAAGDFSARFVVDGDDELGRLAGALDEMQGQLAELESARRRFIATASHELRTPIFSLGGFVELLEDEELDEETRARFLAQLREGVDRLGKLTTDLLDLSRIDAGAVALESETADVGELAETVAGEFVPALAGHDSRLEIRLPGEPVQAVCDPERLAQVVRILVDNAVAHTAEGTDTVIAVSRQGRRARIAVTDFGPGLPRGDIDRVFEPFYTSDGTRGAGLGLAIAHELTGRMNGELTVESEPADVGELAEAVAGEFVPALAGHDSRLEIRLPGEPVQAVCDPERLAQVVRILVDNAVAHTAEGTDTVIAVSRQGRRARIAVTDFGPGVPRGEIDRVFEPFYTSDGTRGAGLGLAIAHELTGRMDGELTVESRPGRTTFAVELPGAPAPTAEPVAG